MQDCYWHDTSDLIRVSGEFKPREYVTVYNFPNPNYDEHSRTFTAPITTSHEFGENASVVFHEVLHFLQAASTPVGVQLHLSTAAQFQYMWAILLHCKKAGANTLHIPVPSWVANSDNIRQIPAIQQALLESDHQAAMQYFFQGGALARQSPIVTRDVEYTESTSIDTATQNVTDLVPTTVPIVTFRTDTKKPQQYIVGTFLIWEGMARLFQRYFENRFLERRILCSRPFQKERIVLHQLRYYGLYNLFLEYLSYNDLASIDLFLALCELSLMYDLQTEMQAARLGLKAIEDKSVLRWLTPGMVFLKALACVAEHTFDLIDLPLDSVVAFILRDLSLPSPDEQLAKAMANLQDLKEQTTHADTYWNFFPFDMHIALLQRRRSLYGEKLTIQVYRSIARLSDPLEKTAAQLDFWHTFRDLLPLHFYSNCSSQGDDPAAWREHEYTAFQRHILSCMYARNKINCLLEEIDRLHLCPHHRKCQHVFPGAPLHQKIDCPHFDFLGNLLKGRLGIVDFLSATEPTQG